MEIDDLTRRAGEWLGGQGPLSEVVISSRIRLARNLESHTFLSRADESQRREVYRMLTDRIAEAELGDDFLVVDVGETEALDRQLLVERHLISKQHADAEGCRGAVISGDERRALMINEEDHLRIQCLRGGLQLDTLWEEINGIDDGLESRVAYAFDRRFGYLTACPTNVGTGIRVSVMLHLPGVKMTNEIERVFQAARDMRLAIRGLYGEGTDAIGDFFQVSNQTTLGKSEVQIISEFGSDIIPRIVEYEMAARETLAKERPYQLDDKIWRGYGTLANARTIGTEETLYLLSHVRLGVQMKRFKLTDLGTVNELFLLTQRAHLQKLNGGPLDPAQRSIARAELLRERLGSAN
ncbi:MAG: protein arginine kinase [Planctomycetota bacterium]|jgi:protein arginine kinase